jgi:uncharacterized protein (TIGR00369 family)
MFSTDDLRALNDTAHFNRWLGIEVVSAEQGLATIRIPWRPELGQYAGFAHAGVVSALVDTACGYAAASTSGAVLTSHCSVNYLAPAVGTSFTCTARVVKAGRRQVVTSAELYAHRDGADHLVATGQALLVPTG